MKKNIVGLKTAILTMSLVQMATNGIAGVLAEIASTFSDVSIATIQMLMTFPGIFIMFTSVLFIGVSKRVNKKSLAVGGLICCVLAGILPVLYHSSLLYLFICEAMLGSGIGIIIPVATGTIAEQFIGNEKENMMGYQTAAANVGSMLMSFFAGIFAVSGWNWAFLVYLIAVPGLLCTLIFYPKNKTSKRKKNQPDNFVLDSNMMKYAVFAGIGMILFYIGPTNLSLLFSERQMGNSVTAGIGMTLILLGGTFSGVLFGRISSRIGRQTITVGFFMLSLGYLLIFLGHSIPVIYFGSFLSGSSISMIMPQCMMRASSTPKSAVMAMSIVFAVANLGGFITPLLMSMIDQVCGNESASGHFRIMSGIAFIAAVAFGYGFYKNKQDRKNKKEVFR